MSAAIPVRGREGGRKGEEEEEEEEEEEDATDVFQQLEVLSSEVQRINQWKRPTRLTSCSVQFP